MSDKKMNIKNPLGLSIEFLENGSIRSIEADPIRISLKLATLYSKAGANIYLRKRTKPIEFKALLGPESNSRFEVMEDCFIARGSWAGLDYMCVLQLSKKSLSWQWLIDITNISGDLIELDLIYVQDAGLKAITDGLLNEYYVSQYLERRILEDENFGSVICCRQNMKESVGNPWLLMGCMNGACAASVDGMQFYGKTCRETGIPEGLLTEKLGGEYSGESSVLAIQEKPFKLAPGDLHKSIFVATYLHDHPKATSNEDLKMLPGIEPESALPFLQSYSPTVLQSYSPTVLQSYSPFHVDDLNDGELNSFFGEERRHAEELNGRLLSFFSNKNHIVLRAKEVLADRPHAHIMQAATGFAPDENIVSTTSFAFGVFNSHLSQGNTNLDILLSVCSSQFNLDRESGQRIFVEIEGRKYLLGVPSAFEIGLNHCRWIYKHDGHCFQVRTWTSMSSPTVNMDFKVISGEKVRLLITHDFDTLNGWKILPGNVNFEFVAKPKNGSMIKGKFPQAQFRIIINSADSDFKACGEEVLFNDNNSHGGSLFVLDVPETSEFCMSFIGEVCSAVKTAIIENADDRWGSDCADVQAFWQDLSLNLSLDGNQKDVAAIREVLPWYGMNALTHFLTPYGLEQFSGAAWGTRDVAQGPVDLLLSLQKYDEARKVLQIIFSNQDPNGGWPQWWMFDSYSDIRADSAHGDIYYWCIIALSNYIKVTGDLKILGEVLPYYHVKGAVYAEKTPLSEHIDRLINMIVNSFIPGTSLVPFGGGDWNDSLQPVSKELAQRMISTWTVEMNYQAFNQYQAVYKLTGETGKAIELKEICEKIKADFNKYFVKDDVVAGYGLIEEDGSISLLLHPSDTKTGIHYSILPMNRGIISEIFTKEQAEYHQDLIEQKLKGPDGARLMDRPLKYKGGIQTIFQRAESSTFFGREIGLMYVHEHIRYAETQALTGRADAFLKALRQAIPVGYRDIVPCGDIRQSNCYYSSSDVIFKNRYEADERYDEIKSGNVALKGGWRVYSSGPGIYISIILTHLLGLRVESGNVVIDPVMPFSFDGLSVSMDFLGHSVTFRYSVKEDNFGPKSLSINGKVLKLPLVHNKYRQGGAVIPADLFLAMLDQPANFIEIKL
jgi:cellobiose phosphorylase